MKCSIKLAYHGQCTNEVDGPDGRCWKHAREKLGDCQGCGAYPTHECEHAMSIAVCGALLCDRCRHIPGRWSDTHGHSSTPGANSVDGVFLSSRGGQVRK